MTTGASVFSEIISRSDQYEVAKAKADIAFRFAAACLVAAMIGRILDERFPY
jgi:hypothetical protein